MIHKKRFQFLTSLAVLFSFNLAIGQAISVGIGPIFTHTNQKVKMVNSSDDFQNTDYQIAFSYEHFLKHKRVSLLSTFSYFDGVTLIKFREGSVSGNGEGGYTIGVGYSGTIINRLDVGVAYNIFPKLRKFYLKPILMIGIQSSNRLDDVEIGSEYFEIYGPEYEQLEYITAEHFNTLQIVPVAGLKSGFVLWKRIDIGLTMQGVWGFKSYQNMYFKYAYKGVPQETAVFEAKGTGIYAAFSVGYRFVK